MDTLTDRERELVEAAWLFLAEKNDGTCPDATEKLKSALRAYDPPKPREKCIDYVRALLPLGMAQSRNEHLCLAKLATEIDAIREALSTEEE